MLTELSNYNIDKSSYHNIIFCLYFNLTMETFLLLYSGGKQAQRKKKKSDGPLKRMHGSYNLWKYFLPTLTLPVFAFKNTIWFMFFGFRIHLLSFQRPDTRQFNYRHLIIFQAGYCMMVYFNMDLGFRSGISKMFCIQKCGLVCCCILEY